MFLKCIFYYFWLVVIGLHLVYGDDETSLIPTRYEVWFTDVDMDSMQFVGAVEIDVNVTKGKNKIKLNSIGLNISSVNLKWNDRMTLQTTYLAVEEDEILEIRSDALEPGFYSISVDYQGSINRKSIGFFKTNCRSPQNSSWIGGVSLEHINTRSVIPSFDDDEVKTPVVVHMVLKQEYRVIAYNAITTPVGGGMQNVTLNFGEVHLNQIGWVIYPADGIVKYETVKDAELHKVLFCRPQRLLLDIVQNLSREVNDYYVPERSNIYWIMMPDLPAPIFSSLSINYIREHLVEASLSTSDIDSYENLLSIGQALSQQWFGQQITTSSWSDVWLTNGLATFFKHKLAQKSGDGYHLNIDNYINGYVLPRVLERERIPHSLTNHGHQRTAILSLYDQDSLDRAGLILNMVENVMEENSFKNAVANFINETKNNGSAHPSHFWKSVERATVNFPENRKVEEVMKTWINSGGYPIVYAKREGEGIILTQRNVLKNNKDSKGYWWIPIFVTSKNIHSPRRFWLRPGGQLNVPLPSNDPWYMINQDGKGFYRVNYDLENWKNLYEAMSHGKLNEIAGARLMDDALGLAEDGYLSYSVALGFTRLLSKSNEGNIPWSAAIRHLVTIRTLLEPSKRTLWDEYASTVIDGFIHGNQPSLVNSTLPNVNTAANKTDTNLKTIFNKMYLTQDLCRDNMYCYNILKDIIIESHSLSSNYSYYDDMLNGVLCLMIENANATIWQDWFNRYIQSKSPSQEKKILAGLSCTKDIKILDRLLGMFFKEMSSLKRQEFITFIRKISFTEITINSSIISVFGNHSREIQNYVSDDVWMVSDLILSLSEKIYDTSTITKTKGLLGALKGSGDLKQTSLGKQVHRGVQRLELNRNRRVKRSDTIITWLKHRNDPSIDFITASSITTSLSIILFGFVLSVSLFFSC